MESSKEASLESDRNFDDLITTFIGITFSTPDVAQFFLESHNFDIDAAVSTFLESSAAPTPVNDAALSADLPVLRSRSRSANLSLDSPADSHDSPVSSPSSTCRSRSRSPSPASEVRSKYNLRSRGRSVGSSDATHGGNSSSRRTRSVARMAAAHSVADLKRNADECLDSDYDLTEYDASGERRIHAQDLSKDYDADSILNQTRQSGATVVPDDLLPSSSSSRMFSGTARTLSGETVPPSRQQPDAISHTITFWRNGFTVNDGPLRRLDDPVNASFLESIKNSECPDELEQANRNATITINLLKKEENCPDDKQKIPFQGVGRTLGSSSESTPAASKSLVFVSVLNTAPPPAMGLVVDESRPSTSIQLRLYDGTRMVSRFNYHHTIRDIRSFIDASRSGSATAYTLQTVEFPPKQLTDLDQSIEQAGLANSVVIQRL